MKKTLLPLMLSLLLSVVSALSMTLSAELVSPPLSKDNPVSTFSLTKGMYQDALKNGGTWHSFAANPKVKWKTTFKNEYLEHQSSIFREKSDYTFESLLVSPAIDLAKVKEEGSVLSFSLACTSKAGEGAPLRVLLVDENGKELAELGSFNATSVKQRITDYSQEVCAIKSIEASVAFIAFQVKGSKGKRTTYRMMDLRLAKPKAGASITFTPMESLVFDAVKVGEVSVDKEVSVSIRDAEGDVTASITGTNADEFTFGSTGATLTRDGGKLKILFTPKSNGKKEAFLVVTDGKTSAQIVLKGTATGGSAPKPKPIETKELLQDPFFYEFTGDKPSKYEIEGTPTKLTDRRRYSSDTGFGLLLETSKDKEGFIRQKVNVSSVKATTEMEGSFYYCVDASSKAVGPLNIRCRWLDAQGKEITTTEEKNLLNNSNLWFGRMKTYGHFAFRTICPEGAFQFELMIAVAPSSKVRFDDFSFKQLAPKDCTPFTAILPQYMTLKGKVGVEQKIEVALQTKHLGQESPLTYSGNEGDLKIEGVDKLNKNTTLRSTLTFKPSKKGVFVMGKAGSYSVKMQGGEKPATLITTAYVADPANPPTIKVDAEGEVELKSRPNTPYIKEFKVTATGLIESINVSLEQEERGIFMSNTSLLYYSVSGDKLYNNSIKLTFRPKEAKEYNATLVLSTALGDTVRIPIKGIGLSDSDGWLEKFTEEQPMDSRFTGDAWKNYHHFDKGYWYLDGKWIEKGKVELNGAGILALDEWFFSGIDEVSVATEKPTDKIDLEYSFDGGGHFIKATQDAINHWKLKNHRPVMLRFRNPGTESIFIKHISFSENIVKERQAFEKVEDAMTTEGDAIALLDESFNGLRHTRSLALKGWQNIPLLGDKPFKSWQQKDKAQTVVEEECAQISFFSYGVEDNRPHQTWLISPKLSYKKATSKILTFGLRFALRTEDGKEQFGLHILTLKDGKVTPHYLDLTEYAPAKDMKDEEWYNFYIDLSKIKDLNIEDEFFVAYSFDSPIAGNASSLTIMIDDVSFGRSDLPLIKVDKELVSIKFRPGLTSEPEEVNVTAERAKAPIKVVLHTPSKKSGFSVKPNQLPEAGGKVTITYKSDDPKDRAAYILLQTKGAESKMVKLLAKNETYCMVDGEGEVKVYPTQVRNSLHIEGNVKSYILFNLEGSRVLSGDAVSSVNLEVIPQGKYFLVLSLESGETYSCFIEKL